MTPGAYSRFGADHHDVTSAAKPEPSRETLLPSSAGAPPTDGAGRRRSQLAKPFGQRFPAHVVQVPDRNPAILSISPFTSSDRAGHTSISFMSRESKISSSPESVPDSVPPSIRSLRFPAESCDSSDPGRVTGFNDALLSCMNAPETPGFLHFWSGLYRPSLRHAVCHMCAVLQLQSLGIR